MIGASTPPAIRRLSSTASKEETISETRKAGRSGRGAATVLAFDTCLDAVSVALRWHDAGGQLHVDELYEERRTGHAEGVLPMIAEVMAKAGITFGDLTRLAVTIGPGTFAGVRTGVSAARAFSLSAGILLCPTTSLALMARNAVHLLGKQDD